MTEILFECYYCKATLLCSALVYRHLTHILRSSTTTSNLVRIFSHTHFCQETKTIKLTVIFTTSCLVNSILKRTGIHYKSCMQSPISINLSFYCTNRMNPTNHISWSGLAELDGSYSSTLSLTSHCERCSGKGSFKQHCTALAQLQLWPYVKLTEKKPKTAIWKQPYSASATKQVRVSRPTSLFFSKPTLNTPKVNVTNKKKKKTNTNQSPPQPTSMHKVIIGKPMQWHTQFQEASIEYHNWSPETQVED